jgi:sugar lactone lactonase YvrE
MEDRIGPLLPTREGLWVMFFGSGTGARIGSDGRTLWTFDMGSEPWGTEQFVDEDGNLWSALRGRSAVCRVSIDGSTETFSIDGGADRLVPGRERDLWVVGGFSGTVTRLSLTGQKLGEFRTWPNYSVGLWVHTDGTLRLTDWRASTLSCLSPQGEVLATMVLGKKLLNCTHAGCRRGRQCLP